MESPAPARPAGAPDAERAALEAELARQRHEAAERARIARLISETLDLPTAGQRIAESVLDLLEVHSSAIRLLRSDGSLAPIARGGRARDDAEGQEIVPAGRGLVGRAALEGRRST